jgi:hypothetical protein
VLSCSMESCSQTSISKILKSDIKFKRVTGNFNAFLFENVPYENGQSKKMAYGYKFEDEKIDIKYVYSKQEDLNDSSCGYFIVYGKKIGVKGLYEEDFACDLDINSFKVFSTFYKNKNYILLTGINNGSGTSTNSVICHLFDVSDVKDIKYYPLWSKNGGENCFGDFNHDGVLDFLKIRSMSEKDVFKITLTSMSDAGFVAFDDNKFIIIKMDDKRAPVILEKNWF